MVAELGPGECMLLPAQWFHEVSTIEGGDDDGEGNAEVAISLSFWNKYYDESAMPIEGRRSDARRYVEWQTSQAGMNAMEQSNFLLKLSQAAMKHSFASRPTVRAIASDVTTESLQLTPAETNALDKVLVVVRDELSEEGAQSSSRRAVLVHENGLNFLMQSLIGRFGVVEKRNEEYKRGVRPNHCLDRDSCKACVGTNSSLGYGCGWCSGGVGRGRCTRLVLGNPNTCGFQSSRRSLVESLASCQTN